MKMKPTAWLWCMEELSEDWLLFSGGTTGTKTQRLEVGDVILRWPDQAWPGMLHAEPASHQPPNISKSSAISQDQQRWP